MLAKLRLDQTGTFEKLVGAKEISKMLVSFVEGKVHPLAIGAEQGGIDKWDDFVIQQNLEHITHIQIKRQTDRFGSALDECERNTVIRNTGVTELRDLSEFDKTIKSLGLWINSKKNNNDFGRNFRLEFYEGGVEIKKDFKVSDLVNILEIHFRSDTSTPAGLHTLCESDSNMKKCEIWLKSWCDISNIDQIFGLFKVLSIEYSNTESSLITSTKDLLRGVFKEISINDVYSKIISYTSENSSFTGAIKPRHLLNILKEHLLPEVSRWTRFQTDGLVWNISGIHDLEDNNEIERPSVVVPTLWSLGNSNKSFLKIDGICIDNCPVSESLMRMSLHPQGSFDILCSDKSSWVNFMRTKTGGTLGIAENDLIGLPVINGLESNLQIEQKVLTTFAEQETFAKGMHDEMYATTFKLVKERIVTKIRIMCSGELRTEVESRWNAWARALEGDVQEQKNMFSKLLHPQVEGELISGEFRVGLKTVDLIKEALFLLLVVSVCLSDNNDNTWETLSDNLKMNAIGLAYWSGPASGTKRIIEIDDEIGISKLLENEVEQIIIIPQSKSFCSEIFNDDISGDISKLGLLMYPKYPKLLITQDKEFKKKIRDADINALREFFKNKLNQYQSVINSAVDEVIS